MIAKPAIMDYFIFAISKQNIPFLLLYANEDRKKKKQNVRESASNSKSKKKKETIFTDWRKRLMSTWEFHKKQIQKYYHIRNIMLILLMSFNTMIYCDHFPYLRKALETCEAKHTHTQNRKKNQQRQTRQK